MNQDSTKPSERKSKAGSFRPNFTQIPNILLDEFLPMVSNAAWKILSLVSRKTYGWVGDNGERKEWDALAIPQIEKGTGLSYTSISETLADLVSAGILLRGELTKNGYLYSINCSCDVAAAIEILRPKPRAVYPPRIKIPPTKLAPPTELDPNRVGPEPPTELGSGPQLSCTTKETIKINPQKRDGAQGALLPLPCPKRKPEKQQDPRFRQVCDAIRTMWPRNTVCDIDGRDARAINEFLERKPSFPEKEIALCIVFRFRSEGENLTLPVRRWIGDVDKYQSGPLNRFGDPLWSKNELPSMRDKARVILGGEPSPQLPLKAANDGEFNQAPEYATLSPEKHRAAVDAARRMKQARDNRDAKAYEQAKRDLGRLISTMDSNAINQFLETA